MHLKRQIGDTCQRSIGLQCRGDLCRRAEMHVESADVIVQRIAFHNLPAGAVVFGLTA